MPTQKYDLLTVGELIDALAKYPRELKLLSDYDGYLEIGTSLFPIHAREDGDGVYRSKVNGFGDDYLIVG